MGAFGEQGCSPVHLNNYEICYILNTLLLMQKTPKSDNIKQKHPGSNVRNTDAEHSSMPGIQPAPKESRKEDEKCD